MPVTGDMACNQWQNVRKMYHLETSEKLKND